tara:strand:- start:897 stop:1967 length:1071 start_codon:yes stop_codon:yes gene_type:complete
MELFVLITGGRTGSGFFHSILDGHSEISSLPGEFFFDDFIDKVRNEKNLPKIARVFFNENKYLFNSKLEKFDRLGELGEKRNEAFKISYSKFQEYFVKIYKNKTRNKMNLLISIHLAYSAANKENYKKKKIILLHLHHIHRINKISDLNFKIFYTIRDPLANISAFFLNWTNFKGKIIDPWSQYYNLSRTVDGINKMTKLNKQIYVIRLEDLHKKNKIIVNKVCKILNLKKEKILFRSTFLKKKWWGDKATKKYLNGVNKNFKNTINLELFFERDIYFLQKILKTYIAKFGYKRISCKKKNFMRIFFPMKLELIIFKDNLKKFNLLELLRSLIYYLKRVFLFINFKLTKSKLVKKL